MLRRLGATMWEERLGREALLSPGRDFDLLYHVSLRPAIPPEYVVPGLVAVTFRLRRRPARERDADPGWTYVTALDVAAALRLGARLGLEPAEALAMVDSHERMHVELQLAGVPEEVEEERMRIVDATWLSLRHPRAADIVRSGAFGLVTEVEEAFWERLIDPAAARDPAHAGGREG